MIYFKECLQKMINLSSEMINDKWANNSKFAIGMLQKGSVIAHERNNATLHDVTSPCVLQRYQERQEGCNKVSLTYSIHVGHLATEVPLF